MNVPRREGLWPQCECLEEEKIETKRAEALPIDDGEKFWISQDFSKSFNFCAFLAFGRKVLGCRLQTVGFGAVKSTTVGFGEDKYCFKNLRQHKHTSERRKGAAAGVGRILAAAASRLASGTVLK